MDELNLKPETKTLLKESLFVQHLPFVKTVIFIATPHGGSYQASFTIVGLFTRLVTLPLSIASATAEADILANAGDALSFDDGRRTFNSINGMAAPVTPGIAAMRKIPVAPRDPRAPPSSRLCRAVRCKTATTVWSSTKAPILTAWIPNW